MTEGEDMHECRRCALLADELALVKQALRALNQSHQSIADLANEKCIAADRLRAEIAKVAEERDRARKDCDEARALVRSALRSPELVEWPDNTPYAGFKAAVTRWDSEGSEK